MAQGGQEVLVVSDIFVACCRWSTVAATAAHDAPCASSIASSACSASNLCPGCQTTRMLVLWCVIPSAWPAATSSLLTATLLLGSLVTLLLLLLRLHCQ